MSKESRARINRQALKKDSTMHSKSFLLVLEIFLSIGRSGTREIHFFSSCVFGSKKNRIFASAQCTSYNGKRQINSQRQLFWAATVVKILLHQHFLSGSQWSVVSNVWNWLRFYLKIESDKIAHIQLSLLCL